MTVQPKISIVIACKNAAHKLRISLENIAQQSYPILEVIIVDSVSTDETPRILQEYNAIITQVICESDSGISEAFNKGVAVATGDYLYFLGAGDIFYKPTSLADLIASAKQEGMEWELIVGKVAIASSDYTIHTIAPKVWPIKPHRELLYKMIYPHQGLLMSRRYFEQYGYFDTRLRYAMDYELLLRSFFNPPSVYLVDQIIAYWLDDGIGADNTVGVLTEYHHIKQWHRLSFPMYLLFLHRYNIFKYYFKKYIRTLAL